MSSRRLAAVLLAAMTVAGACGGGDDDPEVADGARSTTTTNPEGGTPGTEPVPSEGSLTVDGQPAPVEAASTPARAPVVAPSPPAAGSPGAGAESDSGEAFRPAPGAYTYEGESGGEAATLTTRVQQVAEEPAGFRMRQETRDADNIGQVLEVLWTAERVSVERQHNVNGTEESGRCDWRPDVVQYVLPLGVGRRWEVSSTCHSTDPTRPGSVSQRSAARVTDRRTVTIAGVATTVFVIERESTNTVGAGGVSVVQRRTSTELWSPRYGLTVEETGSSTSEVPGQRRPPRAFRYKLVNLRPS